MSDLDATVVEQVDSGTGPDAPSTDSDAAAQLPDTPDAAPSSSSPVSELPVGRDVGFCEAGQMVGVLAEVPFGGIGAVISDDTYVYFTESPWGAGPRPSCFCVAPNRQTPVYRVPRCGGTVETLTPEGAVYRLLVDAGPMIYFTHNESINALGFGRIRKDDGVVELLTDVPIATGPFAGNATHAYFAGRDGFWRYAHDGAAIEYVAPINEPAEALALGDNRILWTAGPAAFSVDLDGGNMGEIYRGTQALGAVADGQGAAFIGARCDVCADVYCGLCDGTESFIRVPVSGSPEVLTSPVNAVAARAGAQDLTWLDATAGVLRLPLGMASEPVRVAPLPSEDADGSIVHRADLARERVHIAVDRFVLSWRTDIPLPALDPYDPATTRTPLWEVRPGTDGFTRFNRIVTDGPRGFVVLGTAAGPTDLGGGPFDPSPGGSSSYVGVFVARFDTSGAWVWSVGLGDGQDNAGQNCLAVGPNGEIVTSVGTPGYCTDQRIRAIAPDGNDSWEAPVTSCVNRCAIDESGGVYVVEQRGVYGGSLVRLDSTGTVSWRVDLSRADLGSWQILALTARQDGVVLARGNGVNVLTAFDGAGEQLWDVPLSPRVTVTDLIPTPDRGFMALGSSSEYEVQIGSLQGRSPVPGFESSFFAKLDPDWNALSIRFLQGICTHGCDPYVAWASSSVAVDSSGSIYVRGMPSEPLLAPDLSPSQGTGLHPEGPFIARFEADGTHVWTHQFENSWLTYAGPGVRPIAIAPFPDGVVVAGQSNETAYLAAFPR